MPEDPGKAAKEKSMQEFAKRTKGKPTPTQDENDRAAKGEHIAKLEADGAELDEGMGLDVHHHRATKPSK